MRYKLDINNKDRYTKEYRIIDTIDNTFVPIIYGRENSVGYTTLIDLVQENLERLNKKEYNNKFIGYLKDE